ncbi:MAG: FAD/NAD(P)-binding protein [Steroidobacteraceae bacterium]
MSSTTVPPATITRRDFLDGVALAVGATVAGAAPAAPASPPPAAQDAQGYYPPRLQGLRGNHPGSFEAAHALRDGAQPPPATPLPESYDLIIVGAGISGLAAAHFYRERAGRNRRILVLDNHDDFGGHAKRNEFDLGEGRIGLLNGGTLLIDSPRPYGPVAAGLLARLGVDVAAIAARIESPRFYEQLGLSTGVFFDRAHFGADKLVTGTDRRPMAQWLTEAPLSSRAREDILRIETGSEDHFPGLSSDQKKQRLAGMSYRDYLGKVVGADPAALAFYQQRTQGEWTVGIDGLSALDCWGVGLPGFGGLALAPGSTPQMGYTAAGYADTGGSPKLHFPDGNATLARLLVRRLLPEAIPGSNAGDIVTARVDYARLDSPRSTTHIRLNSIVTRARNIGRGAAAHVEVDYLRAGRTWSVRGRDCVLAGYNLMIPFLVHELPAEQKRALHSLVKEPLVYVSVALRHWRAFHELGIHRINIPGGYFNSLHLNPHVNVGGYRSPASPDEPILVHLTRTPCQPGLSYQDQNRAGRAEILATRFETFESQVRDQLGRALAGGDFDADRDILGITVNRWPHGYAREYNPLFDPPLPPEQQPHIIGRRRFGRISIANSDSGAAAYTDSAIDQAHRAVDEVLAG